jgi:hypothetical protein
VNTNIEDCDVQFCIKGGSDNACVTCSRSRSTTSAVGPDGVYGTLPIHLTLLLADFPSPYT